MTGCSGLSVCRHLKNCHWHDLNLFFFWFFIDKPAYIEDTRPQAMFETFQT
jgi:hypothetical protein